MAKERTIKEPIRIRQKKLANGILSLYLDIYRDGKRVYEFLKLYLISEKTRDDKEKIRQTMQLANSIKAKRIVEIQNGVFGFKSEYPTDTLFYDYYRLMCNKRLGAESRGNWGNWFSRHSVRAYKNEPLAEDVVKALEEQITILNREGKLHMQLILNEPKAFQGTMAKYGKFRNANNYIVMAGKKAEDFDERIGYYGEHLVLLAQTLGLNTCWVGLSYSKVPGTYELGEDEKIAC